MIPIIRIITGLGRGQLLVLGLLLLFVSRAVAVELSPAEIENRRCLGCHGQRRMIDLAPNERRSMVAVPPIVPGKEVSPEPATRPELYIGPDALAASPHVGLACVSCHVNAKQLPHAEHLGSAECGTTCHAQAGESYRQSSHAQAAAQGNPNAPTCATCHGGHDILPKRDRKSRIYPFNIVKICGDCHENHAPAKTSSGHNAQQFVSSYLESVHGKAIASGSLIVAATCADCHSSHAVLPANDPRSTVHRDLVPRTCGQCHVGVAETYAKSIHGQKLAEGNEQAPVCSDCHTSHGISRTSTPAFKLDIVNECGQCHDKPLGNSKLSLYDTYRQSYHGQVDRLGYTRAARCSDCHGAHDILPIANSASRLYISHRIDACRRCHPQADVKFAQFQPHADYHDGQRFPMLHAVFLYFVIMMSCAFGFFGLHSVLWFGRSLINRIKHGPHPRHAMNGSAIQRFNRVDRINHALAIVSFFGLTLTGMPLLFSDQAWAMALANAIGGVSAAGILHRIFAIMLVINLGIHIAGIINRWFKGGHHFNFATVLHWFYGPHTMLPTVKDAQDCLGMFRWFFGAKNKPRFDRWTYWEKFDYMAEVGGTFIIGGSGLLLWFPAFFSRFLPGWAFNIAMIVHGYEALLAVGFIFTIHFFNAHLRLEKFPVDDVMFTGRLSEEEFKEERPAEYERLKAQGRLAAIRVVAPPRWWRPLAVLVGIVAMAIGATMVLLIILAGLHLIK